MKGEDIEFEILTSWFRQFGGEIEPQLGIGFEKKVRGIYAKKGLSKNSLLLRCPWKLIIGSNGINQIDESCSIVKALESEKRKGNASMWHLYLNFINEQKSRIPMQWDKEILKELQGLPPYDSTRHLKWFSTSCNDNQSNPFISKITQETLVDYVSRSTDRGIIPIFDIMNHHNGKLNTKIHISEKGVEVWTCREINGEEQIYYSYGIESSSSLFRDYGFIEEWPQQWQWLDHNGVTHTFIMFSENIIGIEPGTEMTQAIKLRIISTPEDYLSLIERHNAKLDDRIKKEFQDASLHLLEGLPTNYVEDEKILNELIVMIPQCEKENELQRAIDLKKCIQYRIAFKKAVYRASKL
ncbi:MAG: SET domain-containing protein [Saprospiraceae bacterium]